MDWILCLKWFVAFLWVFSFPFLFYFNLVLNRALYALVDGEYMSVKDIYSDCEDLDDIVFINFAGMLFAPIASTVMLGIIFAKLISYLIAIKTNEKIKINNIIKGIKKR